ncbi:hypothetical protein TWF281_008658 [Arthrobotrys megalospora]
MPVTIRRLYEDFCARTASEIDEAAALLDPLEDITVKMQRRMFDFFHHHIEELKDVEKTSKNDTYLIKMVFRMSTTDETEFMNQRKVLLNNWTYRVWNRFYKCRLQFTEISHRFNDKTKMLVEYCDRADKVLNTEGVAANAHLRGLVAVGSFQKSGEAMKKLEKKFSPVLDRYRALESVVLTAKDLLWQIHGLPSNWKNRKLKDGSKGLGWDITVRLDENWANELKRLNIKIINDTMVKSNLAYLKNPRSEKYQSLKILDDIFGCQSGRGSKQSRDQELRATDASSEDFALSVAIGALADMGLKDFLINNDNLENFDPNLTRRPASTQSFLQKIERTPEGLDPGMSDEGIADMGSFPPHPWSSGASDTLDSVRDNIDRMEID